MFMLRTVLLLAVVGVFVVESLKCHVVAAGNLSIADTSTAQDCGLGSLTCVKVVDFTRGTYTKQCQTMNCTMNNIQNSVANCQNTSSFGVSAMTCCCYGDACNSAPQTGFISVVGFAAVSAALLHYIS
ncbi:unnamed protein product [Caenorhabditis sp. 36 PRJEB53466]|nr:unnamed protein product [Caenorhabditis sp. 36 PRJEB53466]